MNTVVHTNHCCGQNFVLWVAILQSLIWGLTFCSVKQFKQYLKTVLAEWGVYRIWRQRGGEKLLKTGIPNGQRYGGRNGLEMMVMQWIDLLELSLTRVCGPGIEESLEKLRDQPSFFGITLSPVGWEDEVVFYEDLFGNTEIYSVY